MTTKTVYAAHTPNGVYHTANFDEPTPTWETLNGGLTHTNLTAFCLDRSEARWDSRMFCIDGAYTLYRRTTGDWEAVLTSAEARTLAGRSEGELVSVITDPSNGYVFCLLFKNLPYGGASVLRSTDHGENWDATVLYPYYSTSMHIGAVDADSGIVVVTHKASNVDNLFYHYSVNAGGSYATYQVDPSYSGGNAYARLSRADPTIWFGNVFTVNNPAYELIRGSTAEEQTVLFSGQAVGPHSQGAFWSAPDDALRYAVLSGEVTTRFCFTEDGFATLAVSQDTNVALIAEIADGCAEGDWVLGCSNSVALLGRASVYASTNGYTLVNKSGALWDTSPYTDSIPDGGIVQRGLWVVPAEPGHWRVYSCRYEEAS